MDIQVTEEATSLVHGGDVGTADPVASVTRLKAGVLPAIDLSHSHHVFDAHVTLGGQLSNLSDVLALDSKSLVKSLGEEVVSKSRLDIFNKLEHDGNPLLGEKRRPVIVGSVNPTVKEVVVTIGETLSVKEELVGFLLVKDGTGLR